MEGKAVKFGGTSLCDADRMQKAAAIVREDETRKAVVVSAPGKRFAGDEKITDLLIAANGALNEKRRAELIRAVQGRFDDMIDSLGLTPVLGADYEEMHTLSGDALVSRGEYLCAKIFAALIGYDFIDAAEVIFFGADDSVDEKRTRAALAMRLERSRGAVIPGFYGSMPNGSIRLFSRGGSDITGAIVADAMNASVYENFTDVCGVLLSDPRVIADAPTVPLISYGEMRYLASKGTCVLHADAVLPLAAKQIPTVIRCTENPHGPHTRIVPYKTGGSVGGIVGSVGYTLFSVERTHLGDTPWAVDAITALLSGEGLSPLFLSRDVDCAAFLLQHCTHERADALAVTLQSTLDAELVTVRTGIAAVDVVAAGCRVHTNAAIWKALEEAQIYPVLAVCRTEPPAVTVCVSETELTKAIEAIHRRIVSEQK